MEEPGAGAEAGLMAHMTRHLHSIYIEPSFSFGVRVEVYRRRDGTVSGPYVVLQRIFNKPKGGWH